MILANLRFYSWLPNNRASTTLDFRRVFHVARSYSGPARAVARSAAAELFFLNFSNFSGLWKPYKILCIINFLYKNFVHCQYIDYEHVCCEYMDYEHVCCVPGIAKCTLTWKLRKKWFDVLNFGKSKRHDY